MRVEGGGASLTYCTNVHAGETWPEVRSVLDGAVRAVKAEVAPESPFGVGLRLSARACFELESGGGIAGLAHELASAGLYVFTLNGFPYGQFHGARVKEQVYRPDWTEAERVAYTRSLARILAALLPEGEVGSISTVPGCFKPRATSAGANEAMALNVARAAAELVAVERATGKRLCLALEPEPACLLETSADAVEFFERFLFDTETVEAFAKWADLSERAAEAALRRHVGVCLDACHAAVEFERPVDALRRLLGAGIFVPKIQVSAGLSVQRFDAEALAALSAFADTTYLHQVVARTPEGLEHFLDLGPALERAPRMPSECEWRVHFHVPVFHSELGPFSATQRELSELLRAPETLASVPHFEVETYTFDLLPERYRDTPLVAAIAREIRWTQGELARRS